MLRKEYSERMIDGLVGEIAREGLVNLALKLNNEGDATEFTSLFFREGKIHLVL